MSPDISASSSSSSASPVESAIALLSAARRIVVFSGAGLSKASGIPTYRDSDGLWMNQNALQVFGVRVLQRVLVHPESVAVAVGRNAGGL